jgi:hypothetical protein
MQGGVPADDQDPRRTEYDGGHEETVDDAPEHIIMQGIGTAALGSGSDQAPAADTGNVSETEQPAKNEATEPTKTASMQRLDELEAEGHHIPHLAKAIAQKLDRVAMTPTEIRLLDEGAANNLVEGLPSIPSLPMAPELDDVAEQYDTEPLLLEQRVTVGEVRRHVVASGEQTREIGVAVFGSGDVVRVGTPDSLPNVPDWPSVERRAQLTFHTHPGPSKTPDDHLPSPEDIMAVDVYDKPGLIASQRGLTLYESPPIEYERLWGEYLTETRGFDLPAFMDYGPNRVHYDFVRDVIRPVVMSWDEVPSDLTLTEVLDYMRTQRQRG